MNKYKVIDHGADVGIEAHGKDPGELFENAACGMFGILCDPKKIRKTVKVHLSLKARTREELLRSWLDGLLFEHSANGMVFSDFRADISGRHRLSGTACGEKIEQARHRIRAEIKGVTYHQLEVQRYAIGNKRFAWKARVIFDV